PYQGDVDREGLVEEIFLVADDDQLDQILGRLFVEFASPEARVREGPESDTRQMAGLAHGDVAVQVRHRPERNVVALDLISGHELVKGGHCRPVTSDKAFDETRLGEALRSTLLSVAATDAPHQR